MKDLDSQKREKSATLAKTVINTALAILNICNEDDFKYKFNWKNNSKRETLYGRICKVIARGKKNSICIEFEDGQKEIVSRYSIKKIKP